MIIYRPSLRLRAIAIIFLVGLLTLASWRFQLDDALIYYRYTRNALHGIGFVFNIGENVNALTSPLYSYLLLFTSFALHGHIHLASSLIFLVSTAIACILAESLVTYSGLFLASMSYFYTLVGMETSLLLMLIVLLLVLYERGHLAWIPFFLVLLLLTRTEAGAFIPVLVFRMYRDKKWPPLGSLIPVAGILAAYLAITHVLYQTFIPHSASAKLGQGASGYWGKWPKAFLHVGPLQGASKYAPYTMPLLAVVGSVGLSKLERLRWNYVLMPALCIMGSFYILFNIPNYHWYYAPFILGLALYLCSFLDRYRAAQALLLVLIAAQSLAAWRFLRTPETRNVDYRNIAIWLNKYADPTSTLEACEIGEVGWETPRRIIDIIGLTEPKNADHIAHRDITSWLQEDHPDYVVVHKKPFVFEQVAVDSTAYERVPKDFGESILLRRKGLVDRSMAPER